MAVEFALDQVSALAPGASPETGLVLFVFVVVDDAETEEAFNAAIEVEEGGADGHEDNYWEEVVEPFPKRCEVDEAAEEVVEGGFFVDGGREEGHEVVGEWDGEFGDLHCVPEGGFVGCVAADEGAATPDADFGHGGQGCGAHVHYPGGGDDLACEADFATV